MAWEHLILFYFKKFLLIDLKETERGREKGRSIHLLFRLFMHLSIVCVLTNPRLWRIGTTLQAAEPPSRGLAWEHFKIILLPQGLYVISRSQPLPFVSLGIAAHPTPGAPASLGACLSLSSAGCQCPASAPGPAGWMRTTKQL